MEDIFEDLSRDRLKTEIKITDIIRSMRIPTKIKGYHYLRAAILITLCENKINMITKEIYPVVAQKYDSTPSRVERDIRHAIKIAWDNSSTQVLDCYFGYSVYNSLNRPTNSEFISTISDCIRLGIK